MQAIITKHYGPTGTKGSRIAAKCSTGKLTVEYNHALSYEDNHKAAARALQVKLGWTTDFHGQLASGQLHDGRYAHVFTH